MGRRNRAPGGGGESDNRRTDSYRRRSSVSSDESATRRRNHPKRTRYSSGGREGEKMHLRRRSTSSDVSAPRQGKQPKRTESSRGGREKDTLHLVPTRRRRSISSDESASGRGKQPKQNLGSRGGRECDKMHQVPTRRRRSLSSDESTSGRGKQPKRAREAARGDRQVPAAVGGRAGREGEEALLGFDRSKARGSRRERGQDEILSGACAQQPSQVLNKGQIPATIGARGGHEREQALTDRLSGSRARGSQRERGQDETVSGVQQLNKGQIPATVGAGGHPGFDRLSGSRTRGSHREGEVPSGPVVPNPAPLDSTAGVGRESDWPRQAHRPTNRTPWFSARATLSDFDAFRAKYAKYEAHRAHAKAARPPPADQGGLAAQRALLKGLGLPEEFRASDTRNFELRAERRASEALRRPGGEEDPLSYTGHGPFSRTRGGGGTRPASEALRRPGGEDPLSRTGAGGVAREARRRPGGEYPLSHSRHDPLSRIGGGGGAREASEALRRPGGEVPFSRTGAGGAREASEARRRPGGEHPLSYTGHDPFSRTGGGGGAPEAFEQFLQRKRLGDLRRARAERARLPVCAAADRLAGCLRERDVVIVAGDTGCGKSTQVPQVLLREGYRKVLVTQPRRIAAVSLARRVAGETACRVGDEVGYQVRFDKATTDDTRVTYATEGILLNALTSNPSEAASRWDVIILDEVHERSLTSDFLLGFLLLAQQRRQTSGFKWILMSATVNIPLFQAYLRRAGIDPAVFTVPGKLFPVEVEYRPMDGQADRPERSEPAAASESFPMADDADPRRGGKSSGDPPARDANLPYLRIVAEIQAEHPVSEQRGDVLVFVAGAFEVDSLCADLRAEFGRSLVVLPLHASLPLAAQDEVFADAPPGKRKVVVSTNVAETSLTIDNIRFVIDSGLVKEMSWLAKHKTASLQEASISKASAAQRRGRAGRTGPGKCFRLYSEAEHALFASFAKPEILKTPLQTVLLQVYALARTVEGVTPRTFPFLEKPSEDSFEHAISELFRSDCIAHDLSSITPTGTILSRLPVDLHVGKLVVFSLLLNRTVTDHALTIAAALSVQRGVFDRRSMQLVKGTPAYELRHEFDSPLGDLFTAVAAYEAWRAVSGSDRGRGESEGEWCRKRMVDGRKMRELTRVRKQLWDMLGGEGLVVPAAGSRGAETGGQKSLRAGGDDEKLLQAAIGFGLYDNVATETGLGGSLEEQGRGQDVVLGRVFHETRQRDGAIIHPGSALHGAYSTGDPASPQAVFFEKLLETTQPYLVNNTKCPLLNTLLLTSRQIDCSRHVLSSSGPPELASCPAIVLDYSFLVTFPSVPQMEQTLCATISVRECKDHAMRSLLRKSRASLPSSETRAFTSPAAESVSPVVANCLSDTCSRLAREFELPLSASSEDALRRVFSADLAVFMSASFPFATVRRVSYADCTKLLLDSATLSLHARSLRQDDPSVLASLCSGTRLTEYLTCGSLLRSSV
ncbi:ATP-dependent RNA helicase dhx8 [Diplonema papillatum]|nr:ATP-dependent RNA helicase dhx8 [Diplonema papillatum]